MNNNKNYAPIHTLEKDPLSVIVDYLTLSELNNFASTDKETRKTALYGTVAQSMKRIFEQPISRKAIAHQQDFLKSPLAWQLKNDVEFVLLITPLLRLSILSNNLLPLEIFRTQIFLANLHNVTLNLDKTFDDLLNASQLEADNHDEKQQAFSTALKALSRDQRKATFDSKLQNVSKLAEYGTSLRCSIMSFINGRDIDLPYLNNELITLIPLIQSCCYVDRQSIAREMIKQLRKSLAYIDMHAYNNQDPLPDDLTKYYSHSYLMKLSLAMLSVTAYDDILSEIISTHTPTLFRCIDPDIIEPVNFSLFRLSNHIAQSGTKKQHADFCEALLHQLDTSTWLAMSGIFKLGLLTCS